MKKILLFIAVAMTAVSCSDDDNNTTNSVNDDLLVGKWKLMSLVEDGTRTIELNDCDTGTYKEYKSDNTLHEYYKCGNETYEDVSTYTVSGNTVTTTLVNPGQDDPVFSSTITELSPDILVTTASFTDEENVQHTNKATFNRL